MTFKELRAKLGWTQRQMAAEFGVTERTISRWEKKELSVDAARDVIRLKARNLL